MWVEKSRGKLYLCSYYKEPLTGSRRKASVQLEKDSAQARNKASKKLERLIEMRTDVVPEVMRLSDLKKYYLASIKKEVKASTYRRNESKCNTFEKIFGDVDVNKLTAGMIRAKFMDYKDGKASTFNENLLRFKVLMRWAYRNDFVRDIRFLDKLQPMKDELKKEKLEDKFLESEECATLLEAMKVRHWRDLTEFLILSGLRIGEAMALNDRDIDFKERLIHVSKTYDHNNRIITDPKTYNSRRSVYMQDDLLALTRSIIARAKKNRRILFLDRSTPFFAPVESLTPYDAYRKYLREVSVAVLGRQITPHVLRHTHASLLAEQSLDNPRITLDYIRRRLGHGDSKVTQEIYIHITEKRKAEENEGIREVKLISFG